MPNPWDYAERTGKEHAHQVALFMWANMAQRFGVYTAGCKAAYETPGWAADYSKCALVTGNERLIPELKWLHAIHNQGHGDAIRGAKAKAEGVKTGVADLFLPVPAYEIEGGSSKLVSCGLYIELKVGKNKPSAEQLDFINDMRAAGYAADWVVGWEAARERILAYLQISC